MLGTQAARALGMPLAQLLAMYPRLQRRQATQRERSVLSDIFPHTGVLTLLLAEDVMALYHSNQTANTVLSMPPEVQLRPFRLGDQEVRLSHSNTVPPAVPVPPSFGLGRTAPKPANPLSDAFRDVNGPATTAATTEELLVPVRLSLDLEGFKLRDQFLFNGRDNSVTPEMFALLLIQDHELPRSFYEPIVQSMKTQITLFTNMSEIEMPPRRAVIKVELPVGIYVLVDQFEWDHDDKVTSPERFAEAYCADLGLGGEYVSLVAFAIHEQLFLDRKAALQDNAPELAARINKVADVFKPVVDHPGPYMEVFSAEEVTRKIFAEERENRRKRRGGRKEVTAAAATEAEAMEQREAVVETPVVPFAPTAAVKRALEKRHHRTYAKAKHDILSHPHRKPADPAAASTAAGLQSGTVSDASR